MAETNGHQNGESRLDRIERAIEHVIGEHEAFRAEHKLLLRSQVLLQESLEKMKAGQEKAQARVDKLDLLVAEIGGKLNALIDIVDRDHREFHQRLARLEGLQ